MCVRVGFAGAGAGCWLAASVGRLMAGRGPAPKSIAQRRNHHEPIRGEWTPLPPLRRSVLPALPKRSDGEGPWSGRTKRAWEAWRQDPATGMYGAAEVQLAVDLAYVYEEWVEKGGSNIAGEIRQRLDGLGLSPKGKQERRWRVVPADEEAESSSTPMASVRTLKIVGD